MNKPRWHNNYRTHAEATALAAKLRADGPETDYRVIEESLAPRRGDVPNRPRGAPKLPPLGYCVVTVERAGPFPITKMVPWPSTETRS